MISWQLPADKGSAIIEYQIVIMTSDGVTFSQELTYCNGADASIVSSRSCLVPLTTLRDAPFSLEYPDLIVAKVRSRNINGWSVFSEVNTDGAHFYTEPVTVGVPKRGILTD